MVIGRLEYYVKNIREEFTLVNDDITVGLWDDIAMYCVETPDLYN